MHHYCFKLQWWMAGSLINCLLILSHHWAKEMFFPTSIDFLWQLEHEAVAFWGSQRRILTKSHYILSSTINIIFLFPKGGYFVFARGKNRLYVILKKNDKSSKLLGLTSKFILLFWPEKKLVHSAFGWAVWGTWINKAFEGARPSPMSCGDGRGEGWVGKGALCCSVSDPVISLETTHLSEVCDKQEWAVTFTYVVPFGFWSISRVLTLERDR